MFSKRSTLIFSVHWSNPLHYSKIRAVGWTRSLDPITLFGLLVPYFTPLRTSRARAASIPHLYPPLSSPPRLPTTITIPPILLIWHSNSHKLHINYKQLWHYCLSRAMIIVHGYLIIKIHNVTYAFIQLTYINIWR